MTNVTNPVESDDLPTNPGNEQKVQSSDTEINPAKTGSKTEVDLEEKEVDSSPKRERKLDENSDSQVPPGSPDRTPVKEPERNEESPKGDPIPLEKKKPRL